MLNSVCEFVYWHVNGERASSSRSGPPATTPLLRNRNMERLSRSCEYALSKRERGKVSLMDHHVQQRGK